MVTMEHIDSLRGQVSSIQQRMHECWAVRGPKSTCLACDVAREYIEKTLRPEIEVQLRRWWAQGCRTPTQMPVWCGVCFQTSGRVVTYNVLGGTRVFWFCPDCALNAEIKRRQVTP